MNQAERTNFEHRVGNVMHRFHRSVAHEEPALIDELIELAQSHRSLAGQTNEPVAAPGGTNRMEPESAPSKKKRGGTVTTAGAPTE